MFIDSKVFYMSTFLMSTQLLSCFSFFSLPCSVFSHQACVQAAVENKMATISTRYSCLKRGFFNCIAAV